MRTITFSFDSSLSSRRVLEAAHDFTDRRTDVFGQSKLLLEIDDGRALLGP